MQKLNCRFNVLAAKSEEYLWDSNTYRVLPTNSKLNIFGDTNWLFQGTGKLLEQKLIWQIFAH